ncbi:DNA ligase 1 [Aristolochia californica]|uniref:DNA ligase 1 n=1 Tax=Aristolochia californica TaxID=171875 RepID=UPI0035DDB162
MLRQPLSSPFFSLAPLVRHFSPNYTLCPKTLKPSFLSNSSPSFIISISLSAMSQRTVADVLMGAARAAADKKRANPAKKQKTVNSENAVPSGNPAKLLSSTPEPAVKKEHHPQQSIVISETTVTLKKKDEGSSKPQESITKSSALKDNKTALSILADQKIPLLKKKGADFKPKSAAFWEEGEAVPFLFLARALDLISMESGRIAITDILCNVFRTVMVTTPGDLLSIVYLSANKIAPAHEGLELGIGDAALIRALAEAYGRKEDYIKSRFRELGDLGLVAKECRSSQVLMFKPQPLMVPKVLDTFRVIAKESGKDSQEKKRKHIKSLLVAATDCEPQYLTRLLQSKMRVGAAEQTLLVALAQAAVYSEKPLPLPSQIQTLLEEAGKIVKQVYSVLPVYDKIVAALLEVGIWKLSETCGFTLGVPIGPMLAKPAKGVSEILDKFQDMEFTCEYKYDGERAQIHYLDNGSVHIYSRNAERNTGKFPDVVNAVSRCKKSTISSFVLDCEVVAYSREMQKILPFQQLSTRARKDVRLDDIKVPVCIFAFDVLYLNGQSLLQEQLKDRRELLYNSFEEVKGEFQFATSITSNDLEEIQKFLGDALDASCEGLIIKTLDRDATYEPSKRSRNWLKLKKDYMDSFGDSLDLVPIAAFHGRGKRTGVYGAFLLACYDEHDEEYQSICKIGTGFSEIMLEERSNSLRDKVISKPKPYYRFADTVNPDVWFEPSEVWEVKAADLSISPVHRAATGIVDPNKGISLRFPRLMRVREDKNPDQATTSDQVADMYRAQKINHGNNNQMEDDED